MHCRTVLALLLTFAVSLSYSQTLWSGNKTISLDAPFNATMGPFNLHTTATLTFTYTSPVQLCIVYAQYLLPHWTQYNADNCLIYLNATKEGGDSIENIPLLQKEYQIGVWLSYVADKSANSTVHFMLTGAVCDMATEYWDTTTCVAATALTSANDTFSATFTAGETKFWTYMTGPGLSHLTFAMLPGEEISAVESVTAARYFAGSYVIHDMSDNNGTLTIISPRQGLWVFSVHAASAGTADFKLNEFKCGGNSAGDGCMIHVRDPFTNMSLVITPEDGWMYLRFVVDETMPLLVSITTNNGSNIPEMYASNGQIPVKLLDGTILADIRNCNREYCDVVRSIVRNVTTPAAGIIEDWYIAIFTTVPGNTTFGLWFNTTCIPDCDTDNHGECEDSGRCLCEIDFEGIDCSISKGLGPQYIVLIIIASLVVASAIIGFVAWAYMRRKRANYEIVS